jgi:ribose transport system ATP-binding protein
MLSARGLTKRYPGVVALDAFDLDVEPGEIHALVGENGAGKSTFLNLLSGAVQRDAGEILLDGKPLDTRSPRHTREAGVSMIHQELALVPQADAVRNIFLGQEIHSRPGLLDRAAMRERTRAILDRLGVDVDLDRPVGSLSMAQRQTVEIARTLLNQARVLAMDEPTSSLSSREIDQLFSIIRQLAADGVAVIYVSHRLEELSQIAHRATILRDGRLVGRLEMQNATHDEIVRLMVGREVATTTQSGARPAGKEALRAEDLVREPALRGVSLTAYCGQILGIAGLVGSGRTELLRAIFGADAVESGRVFVHGRPYADRTPARSVEAGLALIPEDRKGQGLAMQLGIDANVGMSSRGRFTTWSVLRRRHRRAAVAQLAVKLRIRAPDPERPVGLLSGGNQQKVVVARWVCAESDVLLFDEPTRGIDVAAKAEIHTLLDELVRGGAAVVMVSSELAEILEVSDRVLVMREGRVVQELSRADATEERLMHFATGGI